DTSIPSFLSILLSIFLSCCGFHPAFLPSYLGEAERENYTVSIARARETQVMVHKNPYVSFKMSKCMYT
ncbi:hypothetical protein CSUI_003566, partial [Cystoisospora suis]